MTGRAIKEAVGAGEIIRARRGLYLESGTPIALVEAVRVGELLTCISLLAALGVFVFDGSLLHVHMTRGSSRMRSRHSRRVRLPARDGAREVVLHWHTLTEAATSGAVGIRDALAHAVRCQEPRHAVATLDSALHAGLLTVDDLEAVFARLPRRFHVLRDLVDGRSGSGTETLVRLIARALGYSIDLQVRVAGVGFVDLLLDGWLVVECDSREFHSSWEQQVKDYQRDKVLAQQGYCVFRLTAADILYRPDEVVEALRALRHGRARS